ncbi:MAG TPA: sulfatase [bacterium]|jgi:arylsulfatase A-like enzyme
MRSTISVIAVTFTLILSTAVAPALRGGAAPVEKPNIVFILTDDQTLADIGSMPKVQALLAARGVSFSNYFVSYALCCPSRSSILRGQYAHNTGVRGNVPPLGGFETFHARGDEASTIATWLRAAGYRTGYFGKYLNGYPRSVSPTYVPPGWDEWDSPAGGNPYFNFNYRMNENGSIVAYGSSPEDYLTDVLARKAVAFIHQGSRPFFIHLATYAPHMPATPAPRYRQAPVAATAARSPSFNEPDVSDKPSWLRGVSPLTPRQIAAIDFVYQRRLRSLMAVDDLVAAVVDALRASGQLERTYIFFSSDNGFHFGDHRLLLGKNTAYEEDISVPLIVVGPGVPAGRTVPHLALNIDLAPTWADLAGAAPPAFVDGRSLRPLLRSTLPPLDRWRQSVLIEHWAQERAEEAETDGGTSPPPVAPRRGFTRGVPTLAALRTRDYIYIEYATGDRELYDLRQDPFELQNLITSAPPPFLAAAGTRLTALKQCAAGTCRSAEDAPVPMPK